MRPNGQKNALRLSTRCLFMAAIAGGLGFVPGRALAEPPIVERAASAPRREVIAASGNQKQLVVLFDDDGFVARSCVAKDCDPRLSPKLRPPAAFRSPSVQPEFTDISLPGGKHIALVSIEGVNKRKFTVLLAAESKEGDARLLYSGVTFGERNANGRRTELLVTKGERGDSVRLATSAEICGQEVAVSSRMLDPRSLELRAEPGPDPLASRRKAAVSLEAIRVTDPKAGFRLLRAKSASSGDAGWAVDGDAKTAWLEDEPGVGRLAFVSFQAPAHVALSGVRITLQRPADEQGIGRDPRAIERLSLLTDNGVFAVKLPDNALKLPGADYQITLPQPQATRCLALVVDSVFPAERSSKQEPAAFISEVTVQTGFDGASLAELALGLNEGGDAAKGKLSVLEASGEPGIAALREAYLSLDGPARDLARRAIDAAPCEQKLPLYVALLVGADAEETLRGRDRIRRCAKEAGPPLLAKLASTTDATARGLLAEEAVFLAPEVALPPVIALLAETTESEARRALRRAIGKAVLRQAGRAALSSVLADATFAANPLPTRVEVLRALGPSADQVAGARIAFASVADEVTAFRERYLLVETAASLAKAGDERGRGFLERALTDAKEPHLRTRAARLAGAVQPLSGLLVAALDDPEVRVREGALAAIAEKTAVAPNTSVRVLGLMVKDPWTFLRRAAAAALVKAGADKAIDKAIAAAVDFEPAPQVRAEMMRTLGERRAQIAGAVVAERAADSREALEVRAAAMTALGALCDDSKLDLLTELALLGRAPMSEADRKLALAAIGALGNLHPKDLQQRLSPLILAGVPADIRDTSRRALANVTGGCKP